MESMNDNKEFCIIGNNNEQAEKKATIGLRYNYGEYGECSTVCFGVLLQIAVEKERTAEDRLTFPRYVSIASSLIDIITTSTITIIIIIIVFVLGKLSVGGCGCVTGLTSPFPPLT